MVPDLHPRLVEVYRSVSTSTQLEKIAESNDPAVREKAIQVKIAVDAEIFDFIKTALNPWAKKVLTGMAVGGGASVPAGLTGAALLHGAEEKAKRTATDIRNKVLQTALGLAGIGGGLYGLHRLSGGAPLGELIDKVKGQGAVPEQPSMQEQSMVPDQKQASDDSALLNDVIEKLATVGIIDALLDEVPDSVSDETKKLAAEIKILNRGYGVNLLYEISHG